MSTEVLTKPPSGLTLEKLKSLDGFLVEWDAHSGWPSDAPLSVEEKNELSALLWAEEEITWLRVLGTILSPLVDKQFLEVSISNHFQAVFPQDVERMFAYWMRCPVLKDYG